MHLLCVMARATIDNFFKKNDLYILNYIYKWRYQIHSLKK